jgi:hypothetical protein
MPLRERLDETYISPNGGLAVVALEGGESKRTLAICILPVLKVYPYE